MKLRASLLVAVLLVIVMPVLNSVSASATTISARSMLLRLSVRAEIGSTAYFKHRIDAPRTVSPGSTRATMTGVKITMDTYNGSIDTIPRNCATPRVWINNGSAIAVRSVVVVFRVGIVDVAAILERLGPNTTTGERAVGIPPRSKRSVALTFCIDPNLLPKTLPGNGYTDGVTLARSILSFKALP